ncbi:MAG TPA: GNAT family N-acetyltransferase [Pseudomonadota bacterium]|nr:GNAT family N-acetyltransferase [Pseudomonadota bacterium]
MELRGAHRSERDEVLDLLARWYDNREFFARYNLNDPAFRDELCLVARDGGHLVSTAQIFDRKVILGSQAVPMGGIGSVYTLEPHRKRGTASGLMRLAVKTLEHEGFEMSLLFAERLNFYAGFGWRSITRVFTVIHGAPRIPAATALRIERFDSARDLRQVAAIYEAYSGRFDSTAVRDLAYWRGNLRYAGNPDEYFVVARVADGAIGAYARAIEYYGFAMVMEYGYRPEAIEAMLALFRHLAAARLPRAYALDTNRRADQMAAQVVAPAESVSLVTHSIHDSVLEERLGAAGCSLGHHEDNYYMWRVILPQRLSRRFDKPPELAAARALAMVQDRGSLYWTADRF